MTRRSKRELERVIEDLGPVGTDEIVVAHEDPDTGEWYETRQQDGEPFDETDLNPDALVVVISDEVVETGWEPKP